MADNYHYLVAFAINLPIKMGQIINMLLQTFDQYETISVKLKHRLHKCCKNSPVVG